MKFFLFLIVASFLFSCDEDSNNDPVDQDPNDTDTTEQSIENLEIPLIDNQDVIIEHTHYTASYVEEHELSEWIAYELTEEELEQNFDRTDDFRVDPKVLTGTADGDDYSGSGYDRGHLMPAADCTWDETAMSESFFYTNIAPQVSGLNRGEWSELEERFRELARSYDTVWIATGCMLDTIIETIGNNQISVPYEYYKAGLYTKDNQFYSVAFILPNTAIDNELNFSDFKVTIDEIENRLNLDLFHRLDDEIENQLESTIVNEVIFN